MAMTSEKGKCKGCRMKGEVEARQCCMHRQRAKMPLANVKFTKNK